MKHTVGEMRYRKYETSNALSKHEMWLGRPPEVKFPNDCKRHQERLLYVPKWQKERCGKCGSIVEWGRGPGDTGIKYFLHLKLYQ